MTMKSLIRARATSNPLTTPTTAARDHGRQAECHPDRPAVGVDLAEGHGAQSVIVDATDRSMPAVAITKVCPTDEMMRIAAATSIDSMFPGGEERRVQRPEDDDEGDEADESGPLRPETDVLRSCRPGLGPGLGGTRPPCWCWASCAPLPRVPAMPASLWSSVT